MRRLNLLAPEFDCADPPPEARATPPVPVPLRRVRILMLSTIPETRIPGSNDPISICVYPDSDKVGVWPPGDAFG